jgi:hypothetical protein
MLHITSLSHYANKAEFISHWIYILGIYLVDCCTTAIQLDDVALKICPNTCKKKKKSY